MLFTIKTTNILILSTYFVLIYNNVGIGNCNTKKDLCPILALNTTVSLNRQLLVCCGQEKKNDSIMVLTTIPQKINYCPLNESNELDMTTKNRNKYKFVQKKRLKENENLYLSYIVDTNFTYSIIKREISDKIIKDTLLLKLDKIENYCSLNDVYSIKCNNKLYVIYLKRKINIIDTFLVDFPKNFYCISIMGFQNSCIFYKIYTHSRNTVFLNGYNPHCLVVNYRTKQIAMFDL
jgi:uncharacterized pyridoxamine 5'-phosphate oxidase family protein